MIKIALTKGRIEKNIQSVLSGIGYNIEPMLNKGRKLRVDLDENIQIMYMKSPDILYYINAGILDVGILGSDIIYENPSENYKQLADFGTGKCYFALCGLPEYKSLPSERKKKIATTYPYITKKYFEKKGEDVEIIKLARISRISTNYRRCRCYR